ncbi:MAG: hypothetical protein HQL14_03950 [Candidatus Omnitrophica bacterium]|nr:hypothetical protein [Candidatus Omnitrophota bacterium]
MEKMLKIKEFIKSTPVKHLIRRIRAEKVAKEHAKLHNENELFYTLSPALLIGILKAFKMLDKSCEGQAYYEFGLFKGFSFWFAEQVSKEYVGSEFTLYGFDSFEGLPQTKVDNEVIQWAKGNYAASYDFVTSELLKNDADFSRIKLFKGFFQKKYFDRLKKEEKFKKAAICVIDSDIYESCVATLDFIKEYLAPGSVLLFDDYNALNKNDHHGERKALKEFEMSNPAFQKQHLFDFGGNGVAFKVIRV